MSAGFAIGLGAPEVVGKKSLFQPPRTPTAPPLPKMPKSKSMKTKPRKGSPVKRVHVTIDLTLKALNILQEEQQKHRKESGKVLPLWKAASQAIEYYGRSKGRNST